MCASSAGERLVEQQHGRVPGKSTGERDTLALASRQIGDPCSPEVRDPEALEQLVDVGAAAAPKRTFPVTSRCGKSAYSWNR